MIYTIYFIAYTVAAFGFAYVVGHSRISRPVRLALWDVGGPFVRLFVELLECPACLGFWIGGVTGVVLYVNGPLPLPFVAIAPFYTSGANFLLGRATGLISDPSLD